MKKYKEEAKILYNMVKTAYEDCDPNLKAEAIRRAASYNIFEKTFVNHYILKLMKQEKAQ